VSGGTTAVVRAKPAALADRLDPHHVLAASAATVLLLEAFRGSATVDTAPIWPILQATVAAAAFALAWRNQQRLRLGPIVAIGLGFHLAWITIHLGLGVQSDSDSVIAYPRAGDGLLSGHYPSSEYPPGAVLLFALDSLLSGGGDADRVSHAFVMVPFQVATVIGVWLLKTRWSPWFAAIVALWPLNAFFWSSSLTRRRLPRSSLESLLASGGAGHGQGRFRSGRGPEMVACARRGRFGRVAAGAA